MYKLMHNGNVDAEIQADVCCALSIGATSSQYVCGGCDYITRRFARNDSCMHSQLYVAA